MQKHKLYFRIIKSNKDNKGAMFYQEYNLALLAKKVYEIKNFKDNFRVENEQNIASGIEKYNRIYHKKISNIAVENFIVRCRIDSSSEFFQSNKIDKFSKDLYKVFNKYFNIIYYAVVDEGSGEYEFIFFCNSVVKTIFLEYVKDNLKENYYELKDMVGVLSYNLILGGSKAQNPLGIFYSMILDDLKEYSLSKGATGFLEELYKQQLTEIKLFSAHREFENNIILKELQCKYPEIIDDIQTIIKFKNLKTYR